MGLAAQQVREVRGFLWEGAGGCSPLPMGAPALAEGGLLAQASPERRGEGHSPASPGREDDDPSLQFSCLHQQGRHVLGPRVELQHLFSLWCEQEC